MSIFSTEHLKDKHRVSALSRVVRTKIGIKRMEAAKALSEIGDGEATRELLRLAQSDDIAVWQSAGEAIASIRNPAAVPALCDALVSGSYAVTKPVLEALTAIDDDMALSGLLKGLEDERMMPDVLSALKGRNRKEMVEPLKKLLMVQTEQEPSDSKQALIKRSVCRDVVELLSEVQDISTVEVLHHFLRERPNEDVRLRTQAAKVLTSKGTEGKQAFAGYIGEDFSDVERVALLIAVLPDVETEDLLFSVMPPKSADEFGQSLMVCLNRCGEENQGVIVRLLERLDRDNVRSALLLWFVQSKGACAEAAYMLARHGNTRPVLVKRLVDMVRFEEQEIRLRAGNLLKELYLDKLIPAEGVHLIRPVEDEQGGICDFEYIGYKD